MHCSRLILWSLPVWLLSHAAVGAAPRKHIEATGATRECLSLSSVRSTRVVDDQTILFYLKGTRIYRNRLDGGCPTLAATGSFTYRPTGNRLCHTDTITVLDREVRGASCSLGAFEEVTETWGKPPRAD